MSLKFGEIRPWTTELAALERLKKIPSIDLKCSVSPSPKKGHGKVLKKGHFQRAGTSQEGTFKRVATY